jgi:hypothetical protein
LLVEAAPWFENVNRVLPGTLGITLGRNPNGVVQALREGFAPLRAHPVVTAGTVAGVAAVVALRLTDELTGVPFAVALLGVPVAGGLVAMALDRRAAPAAGPGADGSAADRAGDVPLEWLGIDAPFTPDHVASLDRALGLDLDVSVRSTGPAGRSAGVAGNGTSAEPVTEVTR